jgi:predicted kinase
MDRAIWASGSAPADLRDWTYRAAQAVAEDNLRLGRDVIGDCVNDWQEARDGWRISASRAGAEILWFEIVCSDLTEHRRRVETRVSDIPGHVLPDWQAVIAREYHPWDRDRVTIDTAGKSISQSIAAMLAAL